MHYLYTLDKYRAKNIYIAIDNAHMEMYFCSLHLIGAHAISSQNLFVHKLHVYRLLGGLSTQQEISAPWDFASACTFLQNWLLSPGRHLLAITDLVHRKLHIHISLRDRKRMP